MIAMGQPSFCFNSCDIGEPYYEMWRTMVGPKGMTPRQLAGAIVAVHQAALDGCGCPIVNVIINSHGTFGSIYICGLKKPNGEYEHPMDEDDLGVFGVLKPLKIDTIWLVSCRAAFGKTSPSFCQTLKENKDISCSYKTFVAHVRHLQQHLATTETKAIKQSYKEESVQGHTASLTQSAKTELRRYRR